MEHLSYEGADVLASNLAAKKKKKKRKEKKNLAFAFEMPLLQLAKAFQSPNWIFVFKSSPLLLC